MASLSQAELKELHSAVSRITRGVSSLVLSRFGSSFVTKRKRDTTLVTEVDVAAEEFIRKRLERLYPDHGFLGEEGSAVNRNSDFLWVADPIDGTQSFVHGVPTFGSMLAVRHKGQPVAGAISIPALKLHYSAGRGLGCFLNEERIKIKDGRKAANGIDQNEIVLVSSRAQFSRGKKNYDFLFDRITKNHKYVRLYYDCFGLTRVIHGQASVMLEINVPIWDIAPCRVMIEEAGGVYEEIEIPQKASEKRTKLHTALFGRRAAVDWVKKLAGWK